MRGGVEHEGGAVLGEQKWRRLAAACQQVKLRVRKQQPRSPLKS